MEATFLTYEGGLEKFQKRTGIFTVSFGEEEVQITSTREISEGKLLLHDNKGRVFIAEALGLSSSPEIVIDVYNPPVSPRTEA